MTAFITWYLILEVLGFITLPIAFRLFRWLPDRGYVLAKPLGLLLTGYGLWVLVSFRFLRNTRVAIAFVMLLVAAGAVYLLVQNLTELRAYLRRSRRVIVATELLFLVGFAAWTVYRAYNPELDHTEKPMELAFLNAILRSDTFPPHDPWLAGYTISYYYFGYLIAAMLTRLSGVAPAVAFNLMIALLFALTLTGAYSLTYNLIEGLRRGTQVNSGEPGPRGSVPANSSEFLRVPVSSLLFSLLGPLFVAVLGNLEGFLDALHSRGLGSAGFWQWLDILDINTPPAPGGWIPQRTWWWWRASRVITQRDLLGHHVEIIDEFPFFSFLLGDMHPHVLALPFAFLALAVAFNILLGAGQDEDWLPVPRLSPMALLLPLIIGTFGFLHSWDLPTYLALVVAAYGLRRYIELGRLKLDWWRDVVWFAAWLAALSIILFLLFHIGPRPYIGGIGLVGVIKTKLRQFVVMFGLFLFVAISFLAPQLRDWWRSVRNDGVSPDVWVVVVIAVPVAGLCLILGWWAAATLVILIGLGAIVLFRGLRLAAFEQGGRGAEEQGSIHPGSLAPVLPGTPAQFGNPVAVSTIFALLLIVTALALTFVTEFVFVKDRFGTRMNTVFKLYYQAWVMLAVASAFGVYYLMRRWRSVLRWAWSAGLALLVLMTLVYPVLAGYTRAGHFQREATLNGIAYVEKYWPAEYAAIRWLQENVSDAPTILEAPGDSYRADTSRISATTGLPTLLGWGGHETQWRTTVPEMSQREADIATIYQSLDTNRVQQLLDQYDIKYVYIGPAETARYSLTPPQIEKFDTFMERVFAREDVWIFKR